jgi:hypothetical protein
MPRGEHPQVPERLAVRRRECASQHQPRHDHRHVLRAKQHHGRIDRARLLPQTVRRGIDRADHAGGKRDIHADQIGHPLEVGLGLARLLDHLSEDGRAWRDAEFTNDLLGLAIEGLKVHVHPTMRTQRARMRQRTPRHPRDPLHLRLRT